MAQSCDANAGSLGDILAPVLGKIHPRRDYVHAILENQIAQMAKGNLRWLDQSFAIYEILVS